MEKSIFRYIIRYSAKEQFYLLLLIISFQPLYLLSLEIPKIIINSLKQVETGPIPPSPYDIPFFGLDALTFSVDTTILQFLLFLSFLYLVIVLVTGGQKYAINVYIGLVGERLLRRLRYQLYQRVLRFPLKHFRKVGDGAIIPMITQEVEPVGGFAGSAFADPLFQGGQLVIAIGYIIYQDWLLGVAALAFYPVQIILIPRLQKVVNNLSKQRVQNVRVLSDTLGSSIRGVKQIHANNTSPFELSRFSDRIGQIFTIRYQIYRWKFFIKFLNNFIDKLTPFFFFSIGGWLALEGRLDIGALFAALNAYKDVAAPWKEVLRWYQTKEDVRIKYDQVREQFQPKDMLSETQLLERSCDVAFDTMEISGVSLRGDDGQLVLSNINLGITGSSIYGVVGDGASQKSDLALLMAGLYYPSSGRVVLGGRDLRDYSEAFLGRRISYVDNEPFLLSDSLYMNMVYGISNYSMDEGDFADCVEAGKSGNSMDNFHGSWVDYGAYGFVDRVDLEGRLVELSIAVELYDYILERGSREKLSVLSVGGGIDGGIDESGVRERILVARRHLQEHLRSSGFEDLVVPFETDKFNDHAGVLENLVFGSVDIADIEVDGEVISGAESLITHSFMSDVIVECGLYERFLVAGSDVVKVMCEIFADLPMGHSLYQRFSFISADDLLGYNRLLGLFDSVDSLMDLEAEDRAILFSLPFHLVPKHHRLGIVDDDFRLGILRARLLFREKLPEDLRDRIHFYDSESYNDGASVQENLLFGKIATDRPNASESIREILDRFLRDGSGSDSLGRVIFSLGLRGSIGLRGSRLNREQKAKLVLMRALLKGSDVLILDNAFAELGADRSPIILGNILSLRVGLGMILVTASAGLCEVVDEVIFMRGSDIVSRGKFSELSSDSEFMKLL